ncbi:uL15m family ribosomal protein [Methanolobus chelungpuianus]|uniref:Large ribosomal subunit protein uL15 n=1 Tax=Methanolobus chelungpuianus TaxID=502115 RepID=A0AAE3H889_9EURY|nr:uL15m family ribosomal protein [Methanolobus chelungpuianus]MCQ6962057.1 50S ribosomal protein L15 [Methanolobus chelungpuianus]
MVKGNTKKFRGSRTCGGGTGKNRRGAGNRGGRGKCGGNAHHQTRAIQRGYNLGLAKGFVRPFKTLHDASIVNVGELDELADQLVEDGFAELRDGVYHIDLEDLDIEKVLGTGRVSKKLAITACEFSATAKAKIESAGGSCTEPEE